MHDYNEKDELHQVLWECGEIRTFVGLFTDTIGAVTQVRNTMPVPQNGKKNYHPIQQSLLGYLSEENKTLIKQQYKHLHVHCSTFMAGKIWKQPKCPSMDEWRKYVMYYAMEYNSQENMWAAFPFVTI